ncbi:MAG TPA: DUF6597 domain-containing transcriptional factor, partial [Cyclobacteriaceae bacterium]
MLLKDFLPRPELQEVVRHYRIVHFSFNSNDALPVKPYAPRPEQMLAFYPFDGERAEHQGKIYQVRASLTGQQLNVMNRQVGVHFLAVQVIFQPAGLFRLTGIPSHEITDSYFDAESVFSSDIKGVNEQLCHASTYPKMLEIVDCFIFRLMTRRLRDPHPLDQVGNLMLHRTDKISLDWLADQSCLGYKQFERKFKERMGVNPKLFARVTRFDKAFQLKNLYPQMDWMSIAIQCGYYD